MNGDAFDAHFEQVLAPTLSPGDVVMLDNLPAHKSASASATIEAVGQQCSASANSPDCNPIENAFAGLRKAAARTLHDLWNASRDALPSFTSGECGNYFAAAGYEQNERSRLKFTTTIKSPQYRVRRKIYLKSIF